MTSFVDPVLHDQPTWRLREEVDKGDDHDREDGGDGNRWAPGDGTGLELEEAEVDPGLEGVTKTDEQSINDNMATTIGSTRRLTLPDGNDGAELANTKAQDDTAHDELGKSKGRGFQDDTNERADTGEEDDIATTKPVSRPGAGQSTNHGTKDKGGNHQALDGRVNALCLSCVVDRVDLWEGLDPVLLSQETTEASLVVAEADEGWHDNESSLQDVQAVAILTQVGDSSGASSVRSFVGARRGGLGAESIASLCILLRRHGDGDDDGWVVLFVRRDVYWTEKSQCIEIRDEKSCRGVKFKVGWSRLGGGEGG